MGYTTFRAVAASYGFKLSHDEAKRLKKIWFKVYPNMKPYLTRWVSAQNGTYVSPAGMQRSNCRFTQLANGKALQTPGAEGAKEALFQVSRACYDPFRGSVLYSSRPVIFMHDEIVLEVRDDEYAADKAEELSRVMCSAMSTVLPAVRVTAEPVLTRRWVKDAETVRDFNGRLQIWTPS